MKRVILIISSVIAAVAMTGCQTEKEDPQGGKAKTHKLVVNASAGTDTKTLIEAVPGTGSYQVKWNAGDFIKLAEFAPDIEEYYFNSVYEYYSQELTESDINGNSAAFTFELEDRPGAAAYTYVAAYGEGIWPYYEPWENGDSQEYQDWATMFEYTGDYMEPHMLFQVNFNPYQSPLADTFDPYADLMVSKAKVTTEQLTGEAAFSFARLGAIVKITVEGLQEFAGQEIFEAAFMTGPSYKPAASAIYDPVLEKYAYRENNDMEDMGPEPRLQIYPQGVIISEEGTADLWLKMPAGELTDNFHLELMLEEGKISRSVDLNALGKTIKFEDGKLTTFSVGNFVLAIVGGVYGLEYEVNETRDGFTATWPEVELAKGYDCYITDSALNETKLDPVNNGDGTWSATIAGGLAPDNYTLFIKAIPEDGYGLEYDDYEAYYIPVGVPTVWHFAHDAFKDCRSVDGSDDEYIIDFSPGKVRFKNLQPVYDSSWQALKAYGEFFMYSTEPLEEIHSIELWSKDDSYKYIKLYASATPGAESQLIEGEIIEVSHIDAGSGSYKYKHDHKLVRYTFPTDVKYQYYTLKGNTTEIIMTSQYSYVYYFE